MQASRSGLLQHGGKILSAFVAAALLLGLAELFVRWFPPHDLDPYLGEECSATGTYAADARFGINYRSYHDFHAAYATELAPYEPLPQANARPLWAMFGNSFVQAPGMLADTARREMPEYTIFNLGRNEPLPLRLAQIQLLLEQGLRPQRIIVELMPVDVICLGQQPLDSWQVTARGALTYAPGVPPGPLAPLPEHSRLALTAWCRTGKHHGNRQFKASRLCREVVPPLQADLSRLFGHLAELSRSYDVPVTVLLIPTWHQLCVNEAWVFQDTLGPLFRQQGLDVCDVRTPFVDYPDKPALFIPDKHFSDLGNRLLFKQVVEHVRSQEARRP